MPVKNKNQQMKELKIQMAKNKEEKKIRIKALDSLSDKEKIELDILRIKDYIKLCDVDLQGHFKNNIAIQNKKNTYIDLLKKLEERLKNAL